MELDLPPPDEGWERPIPAGIYTAGHFAAADLPKPTMASRVQAFVTTRMQMSPALGWGVDVAHYQYFINHPKLRSAGCDWFGYKATQGSGYRDPFFARNHAAAQQVDFRAASPYHWVSPNVVAADQAANLFAALGSSLPIRMRSMLDAEEGGITEPLTYEMADRLVQKYQRKIVCYTGVYVAGGAIWRSARIRALSIMCVAAYTTLTRLLAITGGLPFDIWQNQGGDGRSPGVGAYTAGGAEVALPCDHDFIYSWDDLDPVVKPPAPTPPPIVVTPPSGTIQEDDDVILFIQPDNDKRPPGQGVTFLVENGMRKRWIVDGNDLTFLLARTGKTLADVEVRGTDFLRRMPTEPGTRLPSASETWTGLAWTDL